LTFTRLPPFGEGSSETFDRIEGRATGVRPGDQIVLYAKSGPWWVQPLAADPFTPVAADSVWKSRTHPGHAYAALLVNAGYHPNSKIDALPPEGNGVIAIVTAQEREPSHSAKVLVFGGYEWQIRQTPSEPGGSPNDYDAANAWTDASGHLHMRISGRPGQWKSAEVNLTRSLGYGSYRFVVRGLSELEPSAVFAMQTIDGDAPSSEMDVEISRWGEPTSRNGQFVIQPYYVPANTVQFQTPRGTSTFILRWSPDRAAFKIFSGATALWDSVAVREHVFTSGVPAPVSESVHMNFYVFGKNPNPLQNESEVVVESFEYLP
jgi:hypothetical protein